MVFTRTTCFFGTSSGIVDSMAGIWNAWPTLRSAPTDEAMSGTITAHGDNHAHDQCHGSHEGIGGNEHVLAIEAVGYHAERGHARGMTAQRS